MVELPRRQQNTQTHAFKIDLFSTDKNGAFPCPACGNLISPDDETEETYSILETRVDIQGLEEIVICCKKCSTLTHLTGFSSPQKIQEAPEEKHRRPQKEKDLCYFAHV